nr:MAG: RNA-dependent RNA polymerase [Sanya bunya-like virus 3]
MNFETLYTRWSSSTAIDFPHCETGPLCPVDLLSFILGKKDYTAEDILDRGYSVRVFSKGFYYYLGGSANQLYFSLVGREWYFSCNYADTELLGHHFGSPIVLPVYQVDSELEYSSVDGEVEYSSLAQNTPDAILDSLNFNTTYLSSIAERRDFFICCAFQAVSLLAAKPYDLSRFSNLPEEDKYNLCSAVYNSSVVIINEHQGMLFSKTYGKVGSTSLVFYHNQSQDEYYSVFFESGEELAGVMNKINPVLNANCDLGMISSYMSASEFFHFTNIESLLHSFHVLQYEFTSFVKDISERGLVPSPLFYKLYYKFRHNTFAFMVLRMLNIDCGFGTDVPLSEYLPGSKKTPDCILENEQEIVIVDFTVSSRYNTADYYKGGGNTEVKYTYEASQVQTLRGKRCRVTMIKFILDTPNVREVCELITNLGGRPNEAHFKKFLDICNMNRAILSVASNRSTIALDVPELETDLVRYPRPESPTTVMLPSEVLLKITSKLDNYKTQLLQFYLKFENAKIVSQYDLDKNRLYYNRVPKGSLNRRAITAKETLKGLNDSGVNFLLLHLRFIRNSVPISVRDIKGNMPVTLPSKLPDLYTRIKPPVRSDVTTYDGNECFDDEYKEIWSTGLVDTSTKMQVYFPPNYFHQLCTSNFDNIIGSKSKKLLVNCKFEQDDIDECVQLFKSSYTRNNTLNQGKKCPKPTFLLPIMKSFEPSLQSNSNWVLECITNLTQGYTQNIYRMAKSKQYVEKMDRAAVSTEIKVQLRKYEDSRQSLISQMKKSGKNLTRLSKEDRKKYASHIDSVNKERREYSRLLGKHKGKRDENIVRVPCKKNTINKSYFKKEMQHFTENKGKYRGFGSMSEQEYQGFDEYIKAFISSLTQQEQITSEDLYNKERQPSNEALNKLKDMYTERYDKFYNTHCKNKRGMAIAEYYSRVAVHLFNESTKPYTSDFVKVENLGYNNMFIAVRGGAKIYKSQMSKFFRIACLMSDEDVEYGGYTLNDNYQVINSLYGKIVLTPWSIIHQDILFDYMTLPSRLFMNLFSAHSRCAASIDDGVEPLLLLPFVLSLHNRRKTETFMHNSRYLIVNPLSKYTNLQGIIESFAGFNYTYLDAWLRESLLRNYPGFCQNMIMAKDLKGSVDKLLSSGKIRDLWLGFPIINSDHLTTFIYVTYMMTKAPVNGGLEQANNLWEILSDIKLFGLDHPDVDYLKDHSLRFNLLEDGVEVYDDDFKYDPVFCNYLGYHVVSYLSNLTSSAELSLRWENLFNQDVDVVANSNGLRSDDKKDFFGRKGYDVVYSHVANRTTNVELKQYLDEILNATDSDAYFRLRNDRIGNNNTPDHILFHIVHKIQRAGGREIACMDLATKRAQNVIEKFLKGICKLLPNEYISIPSGIRHGLIHSDFYEKGPDKEVKHIMNWVLDCRRWAPHSVIQKYVYFIDGAASILPAHFVKHFREFFKAMTQKYFIIRDYVLDKVRNNKKYDEYKGFEDRSLDIANAVGFKVQFSFVMGIFNYLSTFLHAANQIVASEVIRNQCLWRNQGVVLLDPKCHSDDSVVRSYHEKTESQETAVILYDWLLKGANHMLSIKKSQVNTGNYLEFLSVLYLFDRFLPVMPKFASTIPFKPSDKGYSADISFAITQSIEMMNQGGTYEEAFLLLKLTEKFVQKCYKLDYVKNLPHNFLGVIDSHPIELLYSGGYAGLYSCMRYNPDAFWSVYNFLESRELIDPDSAEVTLKWDMSARIRSQHRWLVEKFADLEDYIPDDIKWTLSNSKLGNSKLNLLWYLNKLRDRTFYSSLVDEPVARRYSRIFGSGTYRYIKAHDGSFHEAPALCFKLDVLSKEYYNAVPRQDIYDFLTFICKDLSYFYDSLEGAVLGEITNSSLKEKPVTFEQTYSALGTVDLSSVEYCVYLKEPRAYKLLGKKSNPYQEVKKITQFLTMLGMDVEGLSIEKLYAVSSMVTRDQIRSFRLIMCVPGDSRRVDSYHSAITTLSYNSIKGRKISLNAPSTSLVDWKRKMVMRRIPEPVTKFIELYWFRQVVSNYKVAEKDIFNCDLNLLQSELLEQIPLEWRPLVRVDIGDSGALINQTYWTHWTEEQIRLGYKWYGSGKCYLSIPEGLFCFEINMGKIISISSTGLNLGTYNSTSSWYLAIFIEQSGFFADKLPRDLADPSKIYLGYQSETGLYGIGRGRSFDYVFADSHCGEMEIPIGFFDEVDIINRGSYLEFMTMPPMKVYLFNPLGTSSVLNVGSYLDKDKLSQLITVDDQVNAFVREVASGSVGFSKKDFQFFLRNIERSMLYNIIYHSSVINDIRNFNAVDTPLFRGFGEWKKIHTGFGFPNTEELEALSRNRIVSPLSSKTEEYLKNTKVLSMGNLEMERLMVRLAKIPREERLESLQGIYGALGSDGFAKTMVLVSKSTEYYKSLEYIPKGYYHAATEYASMVQLCILEDGIFSGLLHDQAELIRRHTGKTINPADVWDLIFGQFIVDSCGAANSTLNSTMTGSLIYQIHQELVENGLGAVLNSKSLSTPVYRRFEFNADPVQLNNALADLLNNCTMSGTAKRNPVPKVFVIGKPNNPSFSKIVSDIGKYKNTISRFEFPDCPNKINIHYLASVGRRKQLKQAVLERDTEWVPGVVERDFLPFDEDSIEECEGFPYSEINMDFMEFDEEADIKQFAYTYCSTIGVEELFFLRGMAWNVIISFHNLKNDFGGIKGCVEFFEPVMEPGRSVRNFYKPKTYLMYLGSHNRRLRISGYKRVNLNKITSQLLSKDAFKNHIMMKEGSVPIMIARSDTKYRFELSERVSLFLRASMTQLQEEVKIIETADKAHEDFLRYSGKYDMYREKFLSLVEQQNYELKRYMEGLKKNEKTSNVEDSTQGISDITTVLKEFLSNKENLMNIMNQFLNVESEFGGEMIAEQGSYRYKDELNLLTDKDTLSELESIIPGYWDSILKGEISMSLRQKKDRLKLARANIALLKGEEKKIYTALYQIISALLLELPEKGGNRNVSNNFMLHIDSLFPDYEDDGDNEGLAPYYSVLAQPPTLIPEDLGFLG